MAISPPASPGSWSGRSPDRFRLTGPSDRPDPRVHAYRGDIADIRLADRLFAPHYVRAETCRCIAPAAMMRKGPSDDVVAVSQIMRGEPFELLDRAGGWAWGRSAHDGYVGYLRDDALGRSDVPSHRIATPLAPIFTRPDIKAPVEASLQIGARFGGEAQGDFLRCEDGFIHARHALPLDVRVDPVTLAERLIGLPYLWGGRGAGGIDCSGLVQVALSFAGIDAPRDSDQQRDAIGVDVSGDLRRGDLVFFPGHVGMMVDAERMIHANAWWMATVIEPLADVVARLADAHAQPILARRRPA